MGKRSDKPSGVWEKRGIWYWRPGSKVEREARKRDGLPSFVSLGPAGSREARMRWAELTGRVDVPSEMVGRVSEIINAFRSRGMKYKENGDARSAKTIVEYEAALDVMEKEFGHMRYGRTAADALQGRAIGTSHIRAYRTKDRRVVANRRIAALSSAFTWARRTGMTDYNPCLGSGKNKEGGRGEREVEEWEVEVLNAVAEAMGLDWLHLVMRFEGVLGWRISDIRFAERSQFKADRIKLRQGKTAKRLSWPWNEELRDIYEQAKKLPGAASVKYVFPGPDGEPISLDAFEKRWGRLKRVANRMLAEADILGSGINLQIENLHFHDLRAKAGDDAEEQGQDRNKFLGNSPQVAAKHYARREVKVLPLQKKT